MKLISMYQEIYKKGGRNFGFLRLDPLGCLPFSRAFGQKGRCFEDITPYVKLHNKALPKLLQKLETKLKGFRYSLSDYNAFLRERINHPSKYGTFSQFTCMVTYICYLAKTVIGVYWLH